MCISISLFIPLKNPQIKNSNEDLKGTAIKLQEQQNKRSVDAVCTSSLIPLAHLPLKILAEDFAALTTAD